MAITRIPLTAQTTADFKTKCAGWLRRAKQQKMLAKSMVLRMREMRARATEMRSPVKSWHLDSWKAIKDDQRQ